MDRQMAPDRLEILWKMFFIYLGGPEFCQEDLQSHYTFGNNVSPVTSVILCGIPAPIVHWKFHDDTNVVATREAINTYTYKYTLPMITQKSCGRELTFYATGKVTLQRKLRVFFSKCK